MSCSRLIGLAERLPSRLARFAAPFHAAEVCFGVEAELMAAIIDRESLGGEALQPKGPGGLGDHGFGHGLAQLDGKFHHRFLIAEFESGARVWTDANFNILYAARLLGRNMLAAGGRYLVAIAGYNARLERVQKAVVALGENPTRAQVLAACDACTTQGNYVSDVLERRSKWTSEPLE